jgi:hypothetical protein
VSHLRLLSGAIPHTHFGSSATKGITMSTRAFGRAAAVAAVLAAAGLTAGVGGAAFAQEGDGNEQGPPEVSEEERAARRAALEEFRACMSEHGVELPERRGEDEGAAEIDREQAEAAYEACKDLVPPPPGVSQAEFDEHRAALEEFRTCLSEHGVEAPIPGVGGPRRHRPGDEADVSDEDRERFEAAREACADLLPEPLPGAGRPGPGPCNGPRPEESPAEGAAA